MRRTAVPLHVVPARNRAATSEFARDFLAGLAVRPRRIAPKYFYDAAGSALFDRICELPEYYPTRTELRILAERAPEIAAQIGPRAEIVEFGAGSLTKVRLLFDAFQAGDAPSRYLPVDISGEHLEVAAQRLRADYPRLAIQPVVADYSKAMSLPAPGDGAGQRVGFFPGSTIGNFDPDDALAFLKSTARLLRGGSMLIGVDLIKDPARLHAAYNDAEGVTAAFNLNLLERANRELGANFDLDAFAHYAFYNTQSRRMEMNLVARRTQNVEVCGEPFTLAQGDAIHTESSYKYTVDDFRWLAVRAGYRAGPVWIDDERLFSVHWLYAPTDS
ncbi:MAG: L-histidine N(alpha)-methyltransferase [Betaproteobacteria bacterium]